ncbi:sialic acid binding Ig like lectin 15 [Rhinolophus ferrumequinum]|uniref:Sialic acid binding Ig like lectin 15 n=1 Tax=Rhinolophus ferrumequinum TaxID=59479 RepID=A0A7J7TR96_RHIFE|nr:sialic acid binding Ig like lectin 15 [Rhinolophus ferrumequinum]
MEGSVRLLACLVCVLPMGSFVRTKRDTTRNLLNTDVHSAPTQRWSMQVPAEVIATAGEAAVLPCTFTHPHRHYDGPLTAIWRAGEPYAGPQVFRCAAARGSEFCQTALSLHGRFGLLGNPRRNDLSLRVERLALADNGRYFCRVEFAGDIHDRYESRHGVWLRVTEHPVTQDNPPRPQAQESNYENLNQMSPRTHRQPHVHHEDPLSQQHPLVHHEERRP